jgi:DNA invertase Pin-like site-specific DNA recombinase
VEKTAVQPTKLVAYYRVSTRKQWESGLGLEAQQAAVAAYARQTGSAVVAEYEEKESGRKTDRERPQLARAVERVRRTNSVLCIAKLDRLARNVHFLSGLKQSGVRFVCCDNPHANDMTIYILAAVAEDEAKRIGERTRAALGAYKAGRRVSKRIKELYPDGVPADVARARGGKLGARLPECHRLTPADARKGSRRGTATNVARARELVDSVGPIAAALRARGMTLWAIAGALNERHYVTRRGKPWTACGVLRLLNRTGPAAGGQDAGPPGRPTE